MRPVIPETTIFYKNESIGVKNITRGISRGMSTSSISDPLEFFHTLEPLEMSTCPQILVVDDVLVNRKLLSNILQTLGITSDTCDNGLQAVQMCDVCKFSLVLMDLVMPVMDGAEACAEIKSKDLNRDTPIVFVSANVQSDEIKRCKKSGGNEFVSKPVKKVNVVDMIIKYCSVYEREYVRRHVLVEKNV